MASPRCGTSCTRTSRGASSRVSRCGRPPPRARARQSRSDDAWRARGAAARRRARGPRSLPPDGQLRLRVRRCADHRRARRASRSERPGGRVAHPILVGDGTAGGRPLSPDRAGGLRDPVECGGRLSSALPSLRARAPRRRRHPGAPPPPARAASGRRADWRARLCRPSRARGERCQHRRLGGGGRRAGGAGVYADSRQAARTNDRLANRGAPRGDLLGGARREGVGRHGPRRGVRRLLGLANAR